MSKTEKYQDMINSTEKRVDFLKMELVHERYLDGWTKEGFEKELAEKELTLKKLRDALHRANE